jgi:hypothetical protein
MDSIFYERGKKAIMPNGDILEVDGSITKKNGLKVKLIMENGECIGTKFFRPDGTEIVKGETFITNDGRTFKIE